ncbi:MULTISPECIES: SGNH/GDSL hydrolase family protein [Maribacter]|uniref:SGNH/GDSL hydrolase family protein n=1 Tax=Maribacter flavus TaxID=1658664 RepID=A0ABU7IDN0_9FLAO|nr:MULTISPECIES: SGNH/GDSL hydrolase family protein [Maribacter]MDC6403905.1 SGNH/GDSL hydrolase family protein [Maribacter sp. PR66]MEE1971046.1 SGNH/GDSL hydrolase family protein [Maribacter flavus]
MGYLKELKSGFVKIWRNIGFKVPSDDVLGEISENVLPDGEEPSDFWRNQINRLKRRVRSVENQENLVVFYGSSSIRLWVHMREDIAPLNVLNLGFGGSNYAWCAHYFDEVFGPLHPSKIVLYAGENDLGEGKSPETVLADFKWLVQKIKAKDANIALAIISIKPTMARQEMLPDILETNRLLEKYVVHELQAQFIDVFYPMISKDHKPRPELYMADGLHLNKAGYEIWSLTIRSALLPS